MRTPGGPPGGPKGPKMASGWLPQGSISTIFEPLGPPGGPPRVLILVYHVILLPLDRISLKTANTCYQSIFDGSKIEKIKILVNFSHFWTFWAPLLGPQGSWFSLFHSLQLSPRQISKKNNKSYLPEWNGWWQNPKNSRFWSILAIFGPLGPPWVPMCPTPLVLGV